MTGPRGQCAVCHEGFALRGDGMVRQHANCSGSGRKPLILTKRPDWDEFFLGVAQAVSARGECVRSRVGAVIVQDRRIVSTGYNGTEAGQPSCLDGVCPRGKIGVPKGVGYDVKPCIAIHAENNAILDAVRRGLEIRGGTIYTTKIPCDACTILTQQAGLRVVWGTDSVVQGILDNRF